jgi:hypothetical protein
LIQIGEWRKFVNPSLAWFCVFRREELSMVLPRTRLITVLLAAATASTGAVGQTYYDDQACRQYADQQTAGLRAQAGSQAFGSALLGAGLGAALGGAIGGGRGAGIGAASGAIAGTGIGAANAQNTAAYAQQQYYAFYSQCMQARQPPPAYNAPQPGYAPPRATGAGPTTSDLNRQELNQLYQPAPGYPYR